MTLTETRPDPRAELWRFSPVERMAALWEATPDPAAVTVAVEGCEVVVAGAGAERTGAASHRIEVPAQQRRAVLVRHVGSATYAFDLTVVVGDAAHLDLVIVHDGDRDAVLAESVTLQVGRDATVNAVVCTLGGAVVRQVADLGYVGPGGDLGWHQLAATGAGQHHEHRPRVAHHEPHCRSRITSRMVLTAPDARTVWVGDVLIGAKASQTDTHEDNRNLVLVDGARADAIPNLEIETGDVAHAGHASATGRFDDDQLFYLQSRGLPVGVARRLVVGGFLGQVTDRIPDDFGDLREAIQARIEAVIHPEGPGAEQ